MAALLYQHELLFVHLFLFSHNYSSAGEGGKSALLQTIYCFLFTRMPTFYYVQTCAVANGEHFITFSGHRSFSMHVWKCCMCLFFFKVCSVLFTMNCHSDKVFVLRRLLV